MAINVEDGAARRDTGLRSRTISDNEPQIGCELRRAVPLDPIFDKKTGELLGAHMVGPEVTELIQGYIVGRKLETTEQDLMETVFPHPTLSEMMHETVLDAFDRAVHI